METLTRCVLRNAGCAWCNELLGIIRSGVFSQSDRSVAGEIVDSTGDAIDEKETVRLSAFPKMLIGNVKLDKVWIHADNNVAKIEQLLEDEKGAVVAAAVPSWLQLPEHVTSGVRRDLPFYLLESSEVRGWNARERGGSTGAGAGAGAGAAAAVGKLAGLLEEYTIEPLWQYVARSRRTTNILRQNGSPIPP